MTENLYPIKATKIAAAVTQRIEIFAGMAVVVSPSTKGVWVRLGDDTVVATAGTDNESFVAAGDSQTFYRSGGRKKSGTGMKMEQSHIAVLEEAATAIGTVTVLG